MLPAPPPAAAGDASSLAPARERAGWRKAANAPPGVESAARDQRASASTRAESASDQVRCSAERLADGDAPSPKTHCVRSVAPPAPRAGTTVGAEHDSAPCAHKGRETPASSVAPPRGPRGAPTACACGTPSYGGEGLRRCSLSDAPGTSRGHVVARRRGGRGGVRPHDGADAGHVRVCFEAVEGEVLSRLRKRVGDVSGTCPGDGHFVPPVPPREGVDGRVPDASLDGTELEAASRRGARLVDEVEHLSMHARL